MIEKKRKTDRRTLYTCMVIKNALLELMTKKEYADITVTDICRGAEINRGTFYLHYDNIGNVIDELFDEAIGNLHGILTQIGCEMTVDEKCTYPLCQFLRENPKYHPLFFSDSLHTYVIERMADAGRESFVKRLQLQTGLNEEVLLAIFYFQLNGCLAISKRNIGIPDETWKQIQCHVDRFLKNGFQNL